MPTASTILDQLTQFQQRDLFARSVWESRGLNPSSDNLSRELTTFFHACARQLEEIQTTGYTPKKARQILTSALSQLNSFDFDREEKEFIVDIFHELATIVGVDINSRLNRWLYGAFLATFISIMLFLRPERIVETLRQPCTQCSTPLETHILRKQSGIPDHQWMVVRCSQCNELNLLSTGPNIKEYRYGNYQPVDSLSKEEYTYEQAMTRLQQIKYFRK